MRLFEFLPSRWMRIVPIIALLLLLTLFYWEISRFIHTVMPEAIVHDIDTSFDKPRRLPNISQFHLFGDTTIENAIAPSADSSLSLVGIYVATDPKRSLAIITDSSGQQKVYRVGEQLPNGTTLYKIEANRVIIRQKDDLAALNLPEDQLELDKILETNIVDLIPAP